VVNTVKIVNFLGKVLKTLSTFFIFYNKIEKRKKKGLIHH